jgi:catechol 2,3-dioxygenase-like lactoylglutathione lyase family enzyme
MAKYVCALIAVSDIDRSRVFYEELLGQKVIADFGVNVAFEGSFAIHERTHFADLLGEETVTSPKATGSAADGTGRHPIATGELYFEDGEIEVLERSLRDAGVPFVHPIREQPWAQRVFRCMDPDGHIVEVGEPMPKVIQRLLRGGMSAQTVANRTGMSIDFIVGNLG